MPSKDNQVPSPASKQPSIVPPAIGCQPKDAVHNLTKQRLKVLGLQGNLQMQRFLSHQTVTCRIVSGDENVNEDFDWVRVDVSPTLEGLTLEELEKFMKEKTCQIMLAEAKKDT